MTGVFFRVIPIAGKLPTGFVKRFAGQGLSVALGMALGARQVGKDYQVYALLSDGELDEGMVWEAAMAASHHKVGNLTAIVDN
jgi:transketolase